MNTTTCLDRDQILDLCELIHTSRSGNLPAAGSRTLGLFRCIQVTLLMLRHNLTQELLADIHMVSQSTISRVVAVYTPLSPNSFKRGYLRWRTSTRTANTSSTAL